MIEASDESIEPSLLTSAAFFCSSVSSESLPVETSAYTSSTFDASLESTAPLPFMSPRGRVVSSIGASTRLTNFLSYFSAYACAVEFSYP